MTTLSSRLADDAFSTLFDSHAGIAIKGQAALNISDETSIHSHLPSSSMDRSEVTTLEQEARSGLTNSQ